jgi:uncharacterized RDD family membrane protein YckC
MPNTKTNTLQITTPEGITFSLNLAGPITRFLAYAIDLLCIQVTLMIVGTVIGMLRIISFDLAYAVIILAYFVVQIGYGIALEWLWRGQTIGKRLLRLRVMDEQGLYLQFSQVVIRNLLRFVDSLPAFYLVGGIACLVSRRAQRLGDFAARTVVVRTTTVAEPDLKQLLSDKFNSFREYPHLAARLRQRVGPQEASIALQALLRRNEFEPVERVELFDQIAEYFKTIVEFPQEATDGISDEQYIRNVVDVLFRG